MVADDFGLNCRRRHFQGKSKMRAVWDMAQGNLRLHSFHFGANIYKWY